MKKIVLILILGLASSAAFCVTLQSRLDVPLGIAANDNCNGGTDGSTRAAEVGSFDAIIVKWSEMHSLQAAVTARVARDRAAGLNVMIGLSPTVLTGLRTDIDLPTWVASACGVTQNTASFHDPCLRAQFIADATTYAALQPEYFHLGTEINTLILRFPADNEFAFFGELYQAAVPAVKAVSPNSKLSTSFQYELQTRLEQDNPGGWDNMLSAFRGGGTSLLDQVSYTTYPSSNVFLSRGLYAGPWDIPSGYYSAAAAHLQSSEKVAFTEIGWPTLGSGSESEQKTFLDRLPELMAPAHPSLVTLALLHDTGVFGTSELGSVGVRNCNGSAKPGWAILTGSAGPGSSSHPLGSIQIFPNPLRPGRGHTAMHFTGLPAGAQLKLYTLAGELVNDLSASSFGSASWDGTNKSGQRVASGVYVVYVQGEGKSKSFRVAVER